MEGNGHRLDTEAKGYPAVDGTRVLVTTPWTSSRTKARRERSAHQAMMDRAGLTADIVYIAKPVVPRTEPKPRMRTNRAAPVKTYFRTHAADFAPTNGGNPDA